MRIAVWHNLPSGGGKRALYDHIRGLHARGHEIEVWSPPTADREYLPLGEFAGEHVVDLRWPAPRNHLEKIFSAHYALESMDKHCKACADQINEGSFDILLANSCQYLGPTSIGRFVKIPGVIYLGEPYRALYEALPRLRWLAPVQSEHSWASPARWWEFFYDWRGIWNSRLQAREEVNNAAAFRRILTNSLFSRESILRAYGLDSDVCYLGTDTTRFRNLDLYRENFLIGLGSFTPAKNIRFVIESIALLPNPRPKLVWVGNSAMPYLQEMKTLARDRNVEFIPHLRITDDELIMLLNKAAAMVYAPRLEPFGLAPIEAGACGVPVVAVAEGGVRESVIDGVTGLHVESDTRAMAHAIKKLLSDPTLANHLGENGRSNACKRWSLEALTDRIEQKLYDYAASNPTPYELAVPAHETAADGVIRNQP